jgi:hypothetical protein
MNLNRFHSERLGGALHLGKLPAQPSRSAVRFADLRKALVSAGALPTVPQSFGHGHDLPQGKWKMLGNGPLEPDEGTLPAGWTTEGCGNCTIAGPAHEIMEAAINMHRPVPAISAETCIEHYVALTQEANGTAYNPETGAGDTGLEIQSVNEWRKDMGFADDTGALHKILDPISVEPGNVQELWEAAWLFEKVGIGLVLTEAQMQQFDASPQPTWDYVKGSPEIGGHYVPVVGKVGLLSWAEDCYYTAAFIENQCDEAWVTIEPEEFSAVTGQTLEHYSQADLEKYAVELARQKIVVG